MSEKMMQYMWEWRLYGAPDKVLTDGRRVRIVHPGLPNHNAGPDFFNARIDIDGMAWAGNVELHLRAADWYKHGHNKDDAYDSVILHVVGISDTYVTRADGTAIPQLLLPFSEEASERFSFLAEGHRPLRCADWISSIPRINIADWIDRAGMERLEEKNERISQYVVFTNGDWSQALFIVLARALGFGLNGEPFERLARSLPLSVLARHADSLFQLEALLIGQAGLLSARTVEGDSYYNDLREEYSFLAHKYQLTPLPAMIWKLSGTRPGNMPYRRLATLARLLRGVSSLFSRIMECNADVDQLVKLFDTEFDGYWEHHLTFGAPTTRSYKKALSPEMVRVLLINVAAPLYHAYGRYSGDIMMEESAQKLLTQLPGERNGVMKMWSDAANIQPVNAFESQALLHIRHRYCERHECLRCRIGHKLIRSVCPH